jgi:hypothetical protein
MIAPIVGVEMRWDDMGEVMVIDIQGFGKGRIWEDSRDKHGKLWTAKDLWDLWHKRYSEKHWLVWPYSSKNEGNWWIFSSSSRVNLGDYL